MSEKPEKPVPSVAEAIETLRLHGQSAVVTLEPPDCRALCRLVEYLRDALADVRRERAQLQHQLSEAAVQYARLEKRVPRKVKPRRRAA